jgi:hypothetical protein
MRPTLGSILGRVVAVIASLLVLGIALQLIVAILAPVLPVQFGQALGAGWNMLYSIVSPAIAPLMAVVILGAVCWVVVGKRW